MSQDSTSPVALQREIAELRARLVTAEQLLRARQNGMAPTMADLVLHAPEPMVVVDVTGRVLMAGQAACTLCGGDPHNLPFLQAFPLRAVDGAPLFLPWMQAEANLAPVDVTLVQNGATRHLLFCASPLPGVQSGLFGYLVVLSDITQQLQKEENLRRQEQEFKSLIDNSPDAITRFDQEGRYRYVNPERAKYFGMAPEAIIGKTWWELLTPEERSEGEIADSAFHKIVSSRAELNVEYQTHTPLGMRWVHSRGVPEFDESGAVQSVVVITRDITERRQAEEGLLQIKNDLETAEELARLGSWSLEVGAQGGRWSRQMFRLFGLEPAATPPTFETYYELIHPDDRDLVQSAVSQIDGGFEPISSVFRTNPERVPLRYLDPRWRCIRDPEGRPLRYEGTLLDITQRVQAEAEIRRYAAQLATAGEMGRILAASLQSDEIYQRLGQAIVRLLPDISTIFISRYDPLHDQITAVYAMHDGEIVDVAPLPSFPVAPLGVGTQSGVIRTGQPLIVGDLEKTLAGRTIVRVSKSGFNTQSALYVPLAAQDKILGVLQVQSYTPDRFTQTDVELLTLVGNTAAVAIQNAELFQMTQTELAQRKERERELETVTAISAALRKAPSRAEMLPIILDQLLYHLRVDGAALESYDSATGELITELGGGVWASLHGDRIPRGAGLSAGVLASGQPYFNNDALHDPRLFRQDLFGACRAAAGVPLIVQGQITGLLWIGSQRLLDEHDLHLLTAIGDMAANALRRATLHEQSQAQARQIAQIMDAVPQGVLLIDGAGTVLLANPVARRDLQILAQAQIGAVIDHLGDRPLSELLTSPPMGLWHEVRAAQRIFEIIARPISNGPEPEEWVLVIDDTTQARQVQTEVQQQERLAAVGQLAAGIAHDINNVLGVIVLQAQMLAHSRWMPGNEMERISIITEQSHHATDLIRQVLDFGRQSILERHALNLLSLLQEQIRLLERTLPEHIAVRLEYEPGDYVVYADATSIRQIVMNLAINARDAMPNGGSLTISLDSTVVESTKRLPVAEMAPGEWIRLRFIDTGSGIPLEILPHIFDPFFTTKAPGQGSGLGLAQVHGIVAQHGGHIAVESQVAEGTVSTIYLPALTHVTSATVAVSEPDDGPSGHDEVILIVEDNLLLRTSLREMLEMWGYQVREAVHGQDALKRLAEAESVVDLVLADVVMPEMGGVALVHAMRQRGWQMPVVLMSGHPLDNEITALAEYGVFTWLPKPVPLAQLAQALADALPPRAAGALD